MVWLLPGVPICSSSPSLPTFPSNPAMTLKFPSLLTVDSDTKDARYRKGITSHGRMVSHCGLPDQTSVNEKMLCGAVEWCWSGVSSPCLSGTWWASVSRPQFPQLYNNCPANPEDSGSSNGSVLHWSHLLAHREGGLKKGGERKWWGNRGFPDLWNGRETCSQLETQTHRVVVRIN